LYLEAYRKQAGRISAARILTSLSKAIQNSHRWNNGVELPLAPQRGDAVDYNSMLAFVLCVLFKG